MSQLLTTAAFAQQVPFSAKAFTDVKTTDAHYEAIEFLRTNNILKGYPDGTFRGNQRISRAEFTMLFTNPFFLQGDRVNDCLRTQIGSGATVFFPDVKSDEWYANAVCAAKVNGIIDGYPDGTFMPGHTIIVAEAAKIAANVFSLSVRRDNDGVDERWFTAYVQTIGGKNAIPSSVTKLTQPMTRGEMAEMLYRLKEQVTDKPATSWQTLLAQ